MQVSPGSSRSLGGRAGTRPQSPALSAAAAHRPLVRLVSLLMLLLSHTSRNCIMCRHMCAWCGVHLPAASTSTQVLCVSSLMSCRYH